MQQAVSLLKNADEIVLLPHTKADGDALGSCFALCAALRKLGKTAYVFPEEPPQARLGLIVREEYLCDKGYMPKTVVALDCGEIGLLGSREEAFSGRIDLSMDHHISNTNFARINVVDTLAAATGEIVFDLIKELGVTLDEYMVKCLYVSIASDTGCFSFSNVTAKTFRIGAELVSIHGNFAAINYDLFDSRTMNQMRAQEEVLKTLEFFRNNTIASIVISEEMRKKTGTTQDDTDFFSQVPRRIKGVEVGITYKEDVLGSWRVSLRTNGVVDASAVCKELGGGGHVRAAGAKFSGDLDSVKELVLSTVNRALDDVKR